MNIDLQGSLGFWVFLVVLIALFSAALFRPDRIRQRPRVWVAAGLLAVILFLECVGPLFSSSSLRVSQTAGGAMRVDLQASGMQDYLTAVKVIGVVQHGLLAVAVLIALSAFFEGTAASGDRSTRRAEARSRPRMAEERQPAPRQRTEEDACLSCGQRIPPDAGKCPACGWTWESEDAASG